MKLAFTLIHLLALTLCFCTVSKATTPSYYEGLLLRSCMRNNLEQFQVALHSGISVSKIPPFCLDKALKQKVQAIVAHVKNGNEAMYLIRYFRPDELPSFAILNQQLEVVELLDTVVRALPQSVGKIQMTFDAWESIEQQIKQNADLACTKKLLKIFIRWGLELDKHPHSDLRNPPRYTPTATLNHFYETCLSEADSDFVKELHTTLEESILEGSDPSIKESAEIKVEGLIWKYWIG